MGFHQAQQGIQRRTDRPNGIRLCLHLTYAKAGVIKPVQNSKTNYSFSVLARLFVHSGGTVTDQEVARLRAHDSNISRYRRLLETNLSDFERRYLEQRLSEEKCAVERLRHPASIRESWAQPSRFEQVRF
jgi:hypothetical protein